MFEHKVQVAEWLILELVKVPSVVAHNPVTPPFFPALLNKLAKASINPCNKGSRCDNNCPLILMWHACALTQADKLREWRGVVPPASATDCHQVSSD